MTNESTNRRARANRGRQRTGGSTGDRSERLANLGEATSKVLQDATFVLEQELATGIKSAQQIERRLREEGRIDRADLDEVIDQLRRNADDVLSVAGDRVGDLRRDDVQELTRRILTDVNDLIGVFAGLAKAAPDIASTMAERSATEPETPAEPTSRRRRPSSRSRQSPSGSS